LEGPFASSMVNTLRGLSSVVAGVVLENFVTAREHLHSNTLLDQVGNSYQALSPLYGQPAAELAGRVRAQAFVLSYSDAFLALLAFIAVLLVVLVTLPKRAYPPQPPVPS
jgi:DHA2 family multidrug resistance protein